MEIEYAVLVFDVWGEVQVMSAHPTRDEAEEHVSEWRSTRCRVVGPFKIEKGAWS